MIAHPPERDALIRILTESYPCTALLLSDRADEAIARFCNARPACAGKESVTLERHWLAILRSDTTRALGLPPYTVDVAAYEAVLAEHAVSDDARRDAEYIAGRNLNLEPLQAGKLAAVVPTIGKHVRIEHYGFDAPGIVSAIESCDRLAGLERSGSCTVLFLNSGNRDRPSVFRINRRVESLLAACDGITTGAEIVHKMRLDKAHRDGDDDLERQVIAALEALRARNVLTYFAPTNRRQGEQ